MEQTRKHSKKRDAILRCIQSTTVHPSAEWVYSQLKPQFPDLSLATVYRNLTLFKQEGIIQSLGVVNGLERFDGTTDPHVHFICSQCGAIIDLPHISVLEDLESTVSQKVNGTIAGYSLCFEGTCEQCLQKQEDITA